MKALEIRDRATFIPVIAFDMKPKTEAQKYLFSRAGYGGSMQYIVLMKIDGGNMQATYDSFSWGGRTMPVAHRYIQDNWDNVNDGDVIDVEFILNEAKTIKRSERNEKN